MNTIQDAIKHLRKKKLSYWMVKTTSGKLKGEYEGDEYEDAIQEFADLGDHLITGKYELTVRSSKNNYRGATVFDFEVFNTGYKETAQPQNQTNSMDASLIQMMVDIKTSLNKIEMKLDANKEHTESKFKELAKALSEVFDEKEQDKPLSPMEFIQGAKGLKSSLDGIM
ncbi:hypothetical protein [Runella limosa]|uniref:hypothetical protein n=1 Tax=Runella limosa TaxID=370978 RepID=UPI00048F20BD|nr:hypothetical protein [Runella limosa]